MSYVNRPCCTDSCTHMINALIVCCAGSQKGWRPPPHHIARSARHRYPWSPIITPPLDFLASFPNPVMYSLMKYHHYRLGRANVILVNRTRKATHRRNAERGPSNVGREGQRRLIPNILSHILRTPFQTNDEVNIHSLTGITMCKDLQTERCVRICRQSIC
jgi:hypothetical protein